jgi:hypothetical protein
MYAFGQNRSDHRRLGTRILSPKSTKARAATQTFALSVTN